MPNPLKIFVSYGHEDKSELIKNNMLLYAAALLFFLGISSFVFLFIEKDGFYLAPTIATSFLGIIALVIHNQLAK